MQSEYPVRAFSVLYHYHKLQLTFEEQNEKNQWCHIFKIFELCALSYTLKPIEQHAVGIKLENQCCPMKIAFKKISSNEISRDVHIFK